MDGLILLAVTFYYAYTVRESKKKYAERLPIRDNPNFHREEGAFVKLYNEIMKK